MPRLGLLVAFVLLVAAAAGLASEAATDETAGRSPPMDDVALRARLTDSIAVTRDSLMLPGGCSPREVGALVSRLTDAVNAGDQAALARLFVMNDPPGKAQEPAGKAFRWYSTTEARSSSVQPWRHQVLYDRADLFAYFAHRHERKERLALVEVEVRTSRLPEAVGLTLKVRREADDLPSWLSPFAFGKAGIDCAEQAIYLWSMAQADRDSIGQVCPRPRGWRPSAPIVACTAGPNAPAVAADFRLGWTPIELPKPCRPVAAKQRVRAALSAFNAGSGDSFARSFIPRGSVHPYTASFPAGFVGRARIARIVSNRYRAGDGWTATRLLPPRGTVGLPKWAVYGLEFGISYQGRALTRRASAKLVLDCQSGLLRGWVGPALKTPSATT